MPPTPHDALDKHNTGLWLPLWCEFCDRAVYDTQISLPAQDIAGLFRFNGTKTRIGAAKDAPYRFLRHNCKGYHDGVRVSRMQGTFGAELSPPEGVVPPPMHAPPSDSPQRALLDIFAGEQKSLEAMGFAIVDPTKTLDNQAPAVKAALSDMQAYYFEAIDRTLRLILLSLEQTMTTTADIKAGLAKLEDAFAHVLTEIVKLTEDMSFASSALKTAGVDPAVTADLDAIAARQQALADAMAGALDKLNAADATVVGSIPAAPAEVPVAADLTGAAAVAVDAPPADAPAAASVTVPPIAQ